MFLESALGQFGCPFIEKNANETFAVCHKITNHFRVIKNIIQVVPLKIEIIQLTNNLVQVKANTKFSRNSYGLGKDSSNKNIWMILGVGAGALLGNNIGAQLDEKDRLLAGPTIQQTLELGPDNSVGSWQNPNTGHSGTVVPTQTVVASTGQPCREFITTVTIGGVEQQGYGTACRQADGSWKIVQ